MITNYEQFLSESQITGKGFENFATNRLAGATKISATAKEKGGDALLTYHHFRVKLPYYKQAAAGKFNDDLAKKDLDQMLKELVSGLSGDIKISQVEFQKLMGEIEVVGELLIKAKK